MRTRKKTVNGQEYYYLEESVRLDKTKVYSVFLGRRVPATRELAVKRAQLLGKIYADLVGGAAHTHVTVEELIEAEKHRRRYLHKLAGLGKAAQDDKDEVDTVNFVYTTLSTEGIPLTRDDASLAYRFSGKNVRNVRDENLRVALDMIKGLRLVKESPKGLTLSFVRKLHGTIMAQYPSKNPGGLRATQAYIYLKDFQKTEEIKFRPPAPKDISTRLYAFIEWYNTNLGVLNAIELAALTHLYFYRIHPFDDGNKRTARLLFNKALVDSGYPVLNISKNTQGYFDALVRSVEKNDDKPFVRFTYNHFIHTI